MFERGWRAAGRFLADLRCLTLAQQLQCVILGCLGGVFPVPAATTFMTLALCHAFALSPGEMAVATTMNFLMTPVQIILMPYFADGAVLALVAVLDLLLHGGGLASPFAGAAQRFVATYSSRNNTLARKPSELLFDAFASGSLRNIVLNAGAIVTMALAAWAAVTLIVLMLLRRARSFAGA